MKKKCHIVLGYTPFHALYIRSLLGLVGPGDKFLYLHSSSFDDFKCFDVQFIGIQGSSLFKRILSYFISLKKLRKIYASYESVSLYFPHPFHILGNYCYFFCNNDEVYLYEDGILNYYDALVSKPMQDQMRFKKVVSRLLGFRYRSYDGLISGVSENRVDGVFLSRPSFCANRSRFKKINEVKISESKNINYVCGRVLFIDQDIEMVMDERSSKILRGELYDYIIGLSEDVIYKGRGNVNSKHSRSSDVQFKYLSKEDNLRPVESTVESLRPEYVVSFWSSALINIAILYPSVKCIALGAHRIPVTIDGRDTTLNEVFASAGVQCLEL